MMMSYYEFHGLTALEVESMVYDLEGVRAVHLTDYIGGGIFVLHVLGDAPANWDDAPANEIDPKWRKGDPIYEALCKMYENHGKAS